jgi:MFS family permease
MVVRALLGLAAAMMLMAAATSPLALVVARVVQGTFGGVVEAAAGFVGASGDDKTRGSVMGRSYSATAAGALVGPVAGGVLVSSGGMVVLMVGIAASALTLAGVCAVHLTGGSTAARAEQAAPRSPRQSAIQEIGWSPLLGGTLMFFGVYGLIPIYAEFIVTLVPEPSDAGPWVGTLHAIMWAGTFVGSFFWGHYNDRRSDPLRSLVLASALTAVAVLVQAWITWIPMQAPLRFIQGFAFAALAQSLLLVASQRAPRDQRAAFVGAANSFLLAGQFLGPLAAGGLLIWISPQQAATFAGLTVGAGALWASSASACPRRSPRETDSPRVRWASIGPGATERRRVGFGNRRIVRRVSAYEPDSKGTMVETKAPGYARVIVVAVVGLAVAWGGGYVLYSSNSQCVDGPTRHECAGSFASDAWQYVGFAAVAIGLGVVVAALVDAVHQPRK